MDATMIARFRALVETPEVPSDEERAEMLAALRVEEFWSQRAPAMNDEIQALRQIETSARAVLAAVDSTGHPSGRLGNALRELEAVRQNQAGA